MHSDPNMSYRADIDGLRAVAVLGVVLFHVEKDLVPGGFAGVDIFFVISGYLITLLIYGQVRRDAFSFAQFYKRRINRIIPALFVLIAGVCAIGLAVVTPIDLIRLFKSAAFTAFAGSNLFFWREYGNYFTSGVDEAPLLHTWSLGVEEQFYIVWPVVLLLLARLKPKIMFSVLFMSLLAAVAISEIGVRNAASASYYLLPTRFFELMMGSMLAIFVFHYGSPFGRIGANVAGIVGLAISLGSLFFLNGAMAFPGLNALYPCVGAALVILSGTEPGTLSARALAVKPLVVIGLISYSLYLWHWPLIAYANYLDIKAGVYRDAVIVILSISLAWLSWKFVEIPFRHSGTKMGFPSVVGLRYALPASAMILGAGAIVQKEGLPERFDPRVVRYERIISTAPNELRANCHSPTLLYQRKPDPSCVLGATHKPADALLIGDSYANHFTGMIDELAKQDNVSVMDYTMDGCMPVKGMGFGSVGSYIEKCKARNKFSYDLIASHGYKYVILAGSWPNAGDTNYFTELKKGLERSIESIIASGATPIIILNNQGTTNANCPVRRLLTDRPDTCDKPWEPNDKQRHMFEQLKSRFPNLIYIDPNRVICDEAVCHALISNVPLYRDGGHLNDTGSRLIGKMLLEKGVHLTRSRITN